MTRFFFIFAIISTIFVLGFTSVSAATLSDYSDQLDVREIENISEGATFYGKLDNYPHTYEFFVTSPVNLSTQLGFYSKVEGGNDLSIILVKQQKRGVEEVYRVNGQKSLWTDKFNSALGFKLTSGEENRVDLDEGLYRLEISSPSNDKPYRLLLNNGNRVGYRELLIAIDVFELTYLSILFSKLFYIPLFVILFMFFAYQNFYKVKQKL
jgi:hypothetical protein